MNPNPSSSTIPRFATHPITLTLTLSTIPPCTPTFQTHTSHPILPTRNIYMYM